MPRSSFASPLWAATLALLCLTGPAGAGQGHFPVLALGEGAASGQHAIDLLGPKLDAVAAWYKRSPQAFREMLLRDPLLHIDRQGRLYAVDVLERPLPPAPDEVFPDARAAEAAEAALQPLDQTFLLHSHAGARRTVYLNFKGAVLKNTAWNNGGGPITALPFDLDGDPANFSDAELLRIQAIWQRVAEDYSPFNIDVTTEATLAGRLTRTSEADQVYGTTALITSTSGVYDCGCGGVAYVGVFDSIGNYYKPALVFWNMLGAGNEKYVAEAISHEVGHNLGLSHDGYSGGDYYPGHGDGETGWAPIMGVGYYKSLVQWSQGEYATANNQEDDIVVIGNNGGPLRPDDHGNNIANATPLVAQAQGGTTLLSGSGVIERRLDRDFFSFSAAAGPASISVAPAARSPNLDVSLRLLDVTGKTLFTAQPSGVLAASLNIQLPSAGTYFVVVDGAGQGEVQGIGYSDYGSLGQYSVSGSVPSP